MEATSGLLPRELALTLLQSRRPYFTSAESRCFAFCPHGHRMPPTASLTRPPPEAPPHNRAKRMFVFGVGFVGRYVAEKLLREEDWNVCGTCTSRTKKEELDQMGLGMYMFDATKDNSLQELEALHSATHLLVSIPPIKGIGDPLLHYFEKDLKDALANGELQWICYLSSTSVYGDCGGAWVNEDYPANPKSYSAKERLAAEQGWLDLAHSLRVSPYAFRLGGIYGPGRSALNTMMKENSLSNLQKMRESKKFTARIHVADIYQAIKTSFHGSSPGIYNIVDDDPAPRAEVFAFAKDLIVEKFPELLKGTNLQHSLPLPLQENMRSGEKRVLNCRMKKELGVNLSFPSYKSGLHDILNSW